MIFQRRDDGDIDQGSSKGKAERRGFHREESIELDGLMV